MGPGASVDDAISAGLGWLSGEQLATGELPAVASSLTGPPEWTPDSLKFITALVSLALDGVAHPTAAAIVDRAVGFLRSERERAALWRYWSRSSDLYDYTPPDVDDTACCSMAVATRGDATTDNVAVLLANRDSEGRFYTWLLPRGIPTSLRHLSAVRDELRRSTRRRRAELWANSEAAPGDVDGVVNANVIRYLGPDLAPRAAIEWVASIVSDGLEAECDSWHRNRFTMYASIADGVRRGIIEFERLVPTIIARIDERVRVDGTVGPALDTAMACTVVRRLAGPGPLADRLSGALRSLQSSDGSWEPSVFYFGGPKEQFGWASGPLSTACAVAALAQT